MRIVVAIGGSILIKEYSHEMFQKYADILRKIHKEHEIFVVVGGGKPAREYIGIARDLGCGEANCDYIGMDITRINAKLLSMAIDDISYPVIAENFNEAHEYSTTGRIVIMGGTEPSHSTDAVGAILAEKVKADMFINLTSVDGLYTKDPNKYDDAKLITEISAEDMLNIVKENETKAGTYEFFDTAAIQMIKRSGLETVILNGKDPENLIKVLNGEKLGTKIISE